MKNFLAALFLLVCLSGFGQSLQWRNPTTTQFGSNNYVLTIKSGVVFTNPIINSGSLTGNISGGTNLPGSGLQSSSVNSNRFDAATLAMFGTISSTSNNWVGSFTGNGSGLTNFGTWANVLHYGAIPDGATDSSQAFSNAIASGLPVFVPRGSNDYIVQPMKWSNIVMYGQGPRSRIVLKTAYTNFLFDVRGSTNFAFSDLSFGAGASARPLSTNRNGIAIEAIPTGGGYLKNCSFDGFAGHAVYVDTVFTNLPQNTIHPIVSGCIFWNNAWGIRFVQATGEYVRVNDCDFSQNTYGLQINAGNVSVVNCGITANSYGVYQTGTGNNSHGNLVGCMINHNATYGILSDNTLYGMNVSACQFWSNDILLQNGNLWHFNGCTLGGIGVRLSSITNAIFDGNSVYEPTTLFQTNTAAINFIGNLNHTNGCWPYATNVIIGTINVGSGINASNTVAAHVVNTTTPGFRSTGTNILVGKCPDGGSWILKFANDGTVSTVTNTGGL